MFTALLLVAALQPGMVRVAGGEFKPLFATQGQSVARVAAFAIDTLPVSEAAFQGFAARHPQFAVRTMGNSAVRAATHVSWAAAEVYCKARGARLPTTYEWEYLAAADETQRDASASSAFRQRVLELALRTGSAAHMGRGLRSVWGVRDLHGGVFEWTHDYNGHVRGHHGHGKMTTMCAAGTVQTGDASDYAAFIRYSFRATAAARQGAGNIGFRCAV
jgi:sulfatase modifying factor 1